MIWKENPNNNLIYVSGRAIYIPNQGGIDVSGFISFSMKPDLNSRSVSNDIAQGHTDKFLNPAACLIGMDHEILVTPPIPGFVSGAVKMVSS